MKNIKNGVDEVKKFLFFDTCALLNLDFVKMIDGEDTIGVISDVVYRELEDIKSSGRKDETIKYQARKTREEIDNNKEKLIIIHYKRGYNFTLWRKMVEPINDNKIIVSYFKYIKKHHIKNYSFITCDGCCKDTAENIFGLNCELSKFNAETPYTGFKEIILNDKDQAEFYQFTLQENENLYSLVDNQYLILKNEAGEVVDKYKWFNNKYHKVKYHTFNSKLFGEIKPFTDDIYQLIAMDALATTQVTLLGGPAGSGKSYLALGYLFALLDSGEIDKIIVFCNPVAARNAAKLGFYPGTALEKLLSTQVGHVLASKFGEMYEVERLIEEGKLELIPAADARGYEVPPHCGCYILESQNLTSDLLRLLLQRAGEDTKIIVDGDRQEQLDMSIYEADNGMREMINAFKGESIYGQVDLQLIHRSKIARIAEKMK